VYTTYKVSGYIPPTTYRRIRYGQVRHRELERGSRTRRHRGLLDRYQRDHTQPLEFTRIGANPCGAERGPVQPDQGGECDARVYSTSGALVRTLVNGQMPAGANTVNWNLQDDAGKQVGNGLYLYELNTGSQAAQAKVSVLK